MCEPKLRHARAWPAARGWPVGRDAASPRATCPASRPSASGSRSPGSSGRNSSPSPGDRQPVPAKAASSDAIAAAGPSHERRQDRAIGRACSRAPAAIRAARRSRRAAASGQSAGVTVRATTSDARIARTYASASGRKNEPARPSRKKTGRNDEDHDQAGVDDRAADLQRGVEHDPEGRLRLPAARFRRSRRTMFSTSMIASSTTSPIGDHQPGQDHRVDRRPHAGDHQGRRDQRQRDRRQADQRRPPVEQERDEDHDHQDAADEHRVGRGCPATAR